MNPESSVKCFYVWNIFDEKNGRLTVHSERWSVYPAQA